MLDIIAQYILGWEIRDGNRTSPFHQLPPPAVLHHRQVDRAQHGRHSQVGGRDAEEVGESEEDRGGQGDQTCLEDEKEKETLHSKKTYSFIC